MRFFSLIPLLLLLLSLSLVSGGYSTTKPPQAVVTQPPTTATSTVYVVPTEASTVPAGTQPIETSTPTVYVLPIEELTEKFDDDDDDDDDIFVIVKTSRPTVNPQASYTNMSCQNTVNGIFYDLTPLQALGDRRITPSSGAYDYYVSVCGSVQGPCSSHPSTFTCQVRKSPIDQFESVIAYSDVENHQPQPIWEPSASETGGVKLIFTNGDTCNLRQRVFNVDFQCDESDTRIITIDESPQCTFNMVYPTKVVCPGYSPTTVAPTTEPPTISPTPHTPTSSPSSSDDITVTRTGIGIGIGIGIGCMAIVWLLWCCWDRSRTQQRQVHMQNGYTPFTSTV